jgi:hypothetical protein
VCVCVQLVSRSVGCSVCCAVVTALLARVPAVPPSDKPDTARLFSGQYTPNKFYRFFRYFVKLNQVRFAPP